MSAVEKYDIQKMITAIKKANGKVSLAAKSLRCSRQTIMNYAAEHPEVRDAINDARELTLDIAEDKLFKAINKGHAWAICFYLKTQGKDRGYVERYEAKITDWRSELLDLLRDGKVTPEQVRDELGRDLAQELFESAGISIADEREG